ncbi:MAG: DUF6691 family protein [Candidatus Nanohaloarchaea archaeon]
MDRESVLTHITILAGGLVFGAGLSASNMAKPEIVLDFLNLRDMGLLFVMFGAAAVTGLTFNLLPRFREKSLLMDEKLGLRRKDFDTHVIIGGAIFGIGWGISGACPGSAYASLGIGNLKILWAIGGMLIGAYLQLYLRKALNR